MTYVPYLVPVSAKGIVFEGETVWLRKNEREEWELPGGKIDPGEQPAETVERELSEELGFNVHARDLISAHMYTIQKSIDETKGVLVIIYTCELLAKTGKFEINGEAGSAEFQAFPVTNIHTLSMPEFYKIAIHSAFSRRDM